MKTLRSVVPGLILAGLSLASVASTGCATHERVVVRERPAVEVVRPVEVVRVAPQPVVVQERVVVRP